jgi:hypothetical protein
MYMNVLEWHHRHSGGVPFGIVTWFTGPLFWIGNHCTTSMACCSIIALHQWHVGGNESTNGCKREAFPCCVGWLPLHGVPCNLGRTSAYWGCSPLALGMMIFRINRSLLEIELWSPLIPIKILDDALGDWRNLGCKDLITGEFLSLFAASNEGLQCYAWPTSSTKMNHSKS